MIGNLAWKNIWRNKLRSLVIITSVVAGLFAGMSVLALYEGMMNGRVRTVIDYETGHFQIHHTNFQSDQDPRYFISDAKSISEKLKQDKKIKGFVERTIATGMLATPSGSSGVSIIGIDNRVEQDVSGLKKKLRIGELDWDNHTKGMLIGKKLAKKLKLEVGGKAIITTTDTADNLISSAFRIKGIYQSANAPLDEINIYIKNKDLQDLLGMENQIHELSVLLNQDQLLDQELIAYQNFFPNSKVESWKALSPETELMVETIDIYSFIILLIILIALSFGIMNTMMMSILERRHEIGMMMALGMNKFRILWMVFTETFLLTTIGIPIAIGIGFVIIQHYKKTGLDLSGMGKDLMESFGFDPLIYPSLPNEKISYIVLLVFLTALVSSILPIWKSLKLDPASALQK